MFTAFWKSLWRCLLCAVMVLSVFAAPTLGAYADDGHPPVSTADLIKQLSDAGADANAVFATMSPEQQKQVMDALSVAKIVESNTPAANIATGCRGYITSRIAYNAVGWAVWAYKQRFEWCYDGTRVTWKYTNRWGETYAPLWSWRHVGLSTSGGVGYTYYYSWTQGEFKLCATWCGQYSYPWVSNKGDRYGNFWWNTGG